MAVKGSNREIGLFARSCYPAAIEDCFLTARVCTAGTFPGRLSGLLESLTDGIRW